MNFSECWYKDVCRFRPQECNKLCIRFQEMLSLCEQSNIPSSRWHPETLYAEADLNSFEELKKIKKEIRSWVKDGKNLYIYSSEYGNGKTSWAINLMLAYFNRIWRGNAFRCRGIFVSVPEFLDRNRETMNHRDEKFLDIKETMITCDLVVWDDISSIKLTDYNYSMLFNYLDARIAAGKSNIFTGNLDYYGLCTQLGNRLASRIFNSSKLVEFTEGDKRWVKLNG